MTREQIEALPPGRELDALVAEKVMGYVDVGESFYRTPTEDTYHISDIEFSTDPVAHAALWDKLVADGWDVEVGTQAGQSWAEIKNETSGFSVANESRYAALAKAALLAYSEPS